MLNRLIVIETLVQDLVLKHSVVYGMGLTTDVQKIVDGKNCVIVEERYLCTSGVREGVGKQRTVCQHIPPFQR